MEIRKHYRKYREFPNLSMGFFMGSQPTQSVGDAGDVKRKILIWSVRFNLEISENDLGISIQDRTGKLTQMDHLLFWEPL